MKLHEGLALLKEDGSNWIFNTEDENFRIRISDGIYMLENYSFYHGSPLKKWGYSLKNNFPADDNWQLHTESKFKVGDLVSVRQIIEGEIFGRVVEISNNTYRLDCDRNTMYPQFYVESFLTLIMPAQELAEKLGGSE